MNVKFAVLIATRLERKPRPKVGGRGGLDGSEESLTQSSHLRPYSVDPISLVPACQSFGQHGLLVQ